MTLTVPVGQGPFPDPEHAWRCTEGYDNGLRGSRGSWTLAASHVLRISAIIGGALGRLDMNNKTMGYLDGWTRRGGSTLRLLSGCEGGVKAEANEGVFSFTSKL